jgi:hypothetical protein
MHAFSGAEFRMSSKVPCKIRSLNLPVQVEFYGQLWIDHGTACRGHYVQIVHLVCIYTVLQYIVLQYQIASVRGVQDWIGDTGASTLVQLYCTSVLIVRLL